MVRRLGLTAGLAVLLALSAGLAACGSSETTTAPSPSAPEEMTLRSPEFRDRQELPARVTCEGAGTSPALSWSGVPPKAEDLALVVLDRDAPGGRFAHWTVWNLAHRLSGVQIVPLAGEFRAGEVPRGALEGKNGFGKVGWGPPCPPKGNPPHDYEFTLYALDSPLELKQGASVNAVLGAIARKATARGTLTGVYSR